MIRSSVFAATRSLGTRHLNTGALAELRHLVDKYRHVGHLNANWDPLKLWERRGVWDEVDISNFGLLKAASDAGETLTQQEAEYAGIAATLTKGASTPVTDVVEALKTTYSGEVGAEFAYVEDAAERAWLAKEFESAFGPGAPDVSAAAAKNAFTLMSMTDSFESFLARRLPTYKRYSGEGTEALVPALDAIFASACAAGVKDVVMGKAHRGRLGLLVSLLDYPARKMFWKILSNDEFPADVQALDDVAPHLGNSVDRKYPHGSIHVTLLQNPSHLEAIDPVVVGKVRAKQLEGSAKALPIMIHGDAAFCGQGVVPETFALSYLPGFSVGGSIHVTVNNQIGFTAEATEGRSSTYSSDIAKIIRAPVFHVNAENVSHVLKAATLAVKYRQTFGRDILLDITGYRRHGHNEVDEPSFTQPKMYKAIRARPSSTQLFGDALQARGVITKEWREGLAAKLHAHLDKEFTAASEFSAEGGCMWPSGGKPAEGSPLSKLFDNTAFAGNWSGIRQAASIEETLSSPVTGLPEDRLRTIAKTSVTVPSELKAHPRIERAHIEDRVAQIEKGAVDWATAEAMAFGSLVQDGSHVRLVGQDCQRGTFSQRHAVVTCQQTGARYTPLNALSTSPSKLEVVSSNLSEFAVMGFEYGFSLENPKNLVLWEAQFGDFANAAQIIIDNFLAGSETKWMRPTGMTLLLPHGMDGVGPEHSSARTERFLQLVNSQAWSKASSVVASSTDKCMQEPVNMIVAQPSTPANYFHLLRRQIVRDYRKPLIVIAQKALLRHPEALSTFGSMGPGTAFQPVIGDAVAEAKPSAVKRVIFCSGKMAYDLAKLRAEKESSTVKTAVIRIEELAPFPVHRVQEELDRYSSAKTHIWAQEEGSGHGAWTWMDAHFAGLKANGKAVNLTYAGRPSMAQPAVGLSKRNKLQGDHIFAQLFPKA